MKKRGELTLNNTLSIIIAVIGLSILIFGFVKLWQANADQENKSAQKTIDSLISKIGALKAGENNSFIIQSFTGSTEWYIAGWSKGVSGRPDKCFFDSCICICKGGGTAKECTDQGFCRVVSEEEVAVGSREYLVFSNEGGVVIDQEPESKDCPDIGYFRLDNSLNKIFVKVESEKITVFYDSGGSKPFEVEHDEVYVCGGDTTYY